MRVEPTRINVGMKVYGDDGRKLGKVLAVGPASFTIQRGFLLRTAYLVLYAEVVRVDDENRAYLIRSKPEFFAGRNATPWSEAKSLQSSPTPSKKKPGKRRRPVDPHAFAEVTYASPSEVSDEVHSALRRTANEQARKPSRSDSERPFLT